MRIVKAVLRLLLLPIALIGLIFKQTKRYCASIVRQDVIYLSFLIPLVILLYVVYMNLLPFGFSKEFTLDIGVEGDTDSSRDFYLVESSSLSPIQRYGDRTFREIIGTKPVEFAFKSPVVIDNETEVTFSLEVEGNSSLYIKDGDEWQLFYDPEWQRYRKAACFDEKCVYVNPDWISERCWETVLGEIGYTSEMYQFPYEFRAPLEFEAALDKSLNLEVVKKEKNLLPGEDPLYLYVYDNDDLVYNGSIEDDGLGDKKESTAEKRFNTLLPHSGIYRIVIQGKDNMPTDFTMEKIRINSNKIVLNGPSINPIFREDASVLYTKYSSDINFRYWDISKGKKVVVVGSSNATVDVLNETTKISISGETGVYFPRGDVSIYNGRWEFEKDQWFDSYDLRDRQEDCVYSWEFRETKDLDSWITTNIPKGSSIYFYNEDQEVIRRKYINRDIDFKEGSWTEINTTLRGTHEFYVYLKDRMELEVWKQDLNGYEGRDEFNITLVNFLTGVTIFNDIFEDDGIHDRSDEMPLLKKTFKIDNVEEGIYIVKFDFIMRENAYPDSLIKRFRINTNKIMFREHMLLLERGEFYLGNQRNNEIRMMFGHDSKQKITLKGLRTRTENLSEKKTYTFPLKGINKIEIEKGDLHLWFESLSISKESYFNLHKYYLDEVISDFLIKEKVDKLSRYHLKSGAEGSLLLKKDNIDNLELLQARIVFKK